LEFDFVTNFANLHNIKKCSLIVQKNILEDVNCYICLHSFLYSMIKKNNKNLIVKLDQKFNKNIKFKIETVAKLVNDNDVKFNHLNNGGSVT
jgi:hypothetical protein